MICVCLCSVIEQNLIFLFTVFDLDRLIIKHSTELDNRPFNSAPKRLVLAWALLPNNSLEFAGIKSTISIAMLAGVLVHLRRNERENLSIQTK